MKRFLTLALAGFASLVLISEASAQTQPKSDVSVSVGYRSDDFDWNIAGNPEGTNPDVLSELKWRKLESTELKLRGRTTIGVAYLRGYYNYGRIYNGTNQDTDFGMDNSGMIALRSNNSSDSGDVHDLSAGIGYRNNLKLGNIEFMPLAGLSFHRQNLTITSGVQTVPPTGPFDGLDSNYQARWYGPWIGTDFEAVYGRFTLSGSLEGHLAQYRAEADWNLRADFQHPKSYEHSATGWGAVFNLIGDYALNDRWALSGNLDAQRWKATTGTDRTFFADGSIGDTRLNEVNWSSYSATVGVKYTF